MSEPLSSKSSKAVTVVTAYLEDFLADPQAFRGQQLRGGGPVTEFERMLANRCGFPYSVATCNATSALLGLAVMFRIGGKTVWFPKSHWEGSVSAFRLMGAKIRFYDTEASTFPRLQRATAAPLVIVSKGTDVGMIRAATGSSKCLIIEDSSRIPRVSAENHEYSEADIQVLSFGPGKPLCLGEGGAILFRTRKLHDRFISSSMHPERTADATGRAPRVPPRCLNARIHPVAALLGREILSNDQDA
jgi:dTDP-4-amino-4,6-dideoxygalactose transaminase